jgi:hypothetical protein
MFLHKVNATRDCDYCVIWGYRMSTYVDSGVAFWSIIHMHWLESYGLMQNTKTK